VMLVTFGPPLLLLVGESLQNAGPRGFPAFMETLGQTLLAGTVLAAMFTALSLVVPSLTDRRKFASAGTLLIFLGTGAIAGTLGFGLRLGDSWLLIALNRLPFEVTERIFDRRGLPTPSQVPLRTWSVYATALTVTLVAGAVTWWRVVRSPVTR